MDTNEEPFDVLLQKSYGHYSGQRTFAGTITVTATSQLAGGNAGDGLVVLRDAGEE